MESAEHANGIKQSGEQGLAASVLFRGLNDEVAQELRADMRAEKFGPDQVIFTEGELGERLHVVGAGKVKIGMAVGERPCRLLRLLCPGDLVEAVPGLEVDRRRVTAVAMTWTTTFSIAIPVLRGWVGRRPEIGLAFVRELSRRLRESDRKRGDLVTLDVPARLAKLLLEFAARFGVGQGEAIKVKHHLTQAELADLIGASRETVNLAIADFVSRGWILTQPRGVFLLNREALARRAR